MITSRELSEKAKETYEKQFKTHPNDSPEYKWPSICGIMSAQAAQMIREAAHCKLSLTDTIELNGYNLLVCEEGKPSKVKTSWSMSHDQYKKFLRQMVEDWVGNTVEDWSAVDLGGLDE